MKKVIKTNKALIIIDGNIVKKHFFNNERFMDEYNSLLLLEKDFDGPHILDGWCYKVVKVINKNDVNKEITMDIAIGKTLDELIEGSLENFYHLGRFLGVYYKNQPKNKENKVSYIDFSRNNIFVDEDRQVVTLIDPGAHYGESIVPEHIIALGIISLTNGCIKRIKSPSKYIKNFLKGYTSLVDREINYNILKKILIKELNNNKSKRTNLEKSVYWIYLFIFKKYYKSIFNITN